MRGGLLIKEVLWWGGLPTAPERAKDLQSPLTAMPLPSSPMCHMTRKDTKREEGTDITPGNTFHPCLQYARVLRERLKGEGSPRNHNELGFQKAFGAIP